MTIALFINATILPKNKTKTGNQFMRSQHPYIHAKRPVRNKKQENTSHNNERVTTVACTV